MDRGQKLFHFKYFFTGRQDVFAERTRRDGRYFLRRQQLTDDDLIRHMRGEVMLGSYPLQLDGNTKWVAVDFDNHHGNALDHTKSFVGFLRNFGIEPIVNTSQSGKGYHVRLIFDDPARNPLIGKPVPGAVARRFMLTMLEVAELPRLSKGGAWDRVFPSQDTLITPQSIGNQIGMPLSRLAATQRGGTLILDRQFKPIPLGDATWDAIEMYQLVKNIDIFDASQDMGKLGFVYGDIDDHGNRVYEEKYTNGTIADSSSKRHCSRTELKYMISNCDFIKRVSGGDIPYDLWVALASILAIFDSVGGRNEFQQISSRDSGIGKRGKERYDAIATDQKYDNIRTNFKAPVTCKKIAEDGFVCPNMDFNGVCKKFRLRDGRGARTPATAYYFSPPELKNSYRAQKVA